MVWWFTMVQSVQNHLQEIQDYEQPNDIILQEHHPPSCKLTVAGWKIHHFEAIYQ